MSDTIQSKKQFFVSELEQYQKQINDVINAYAAEQLRSVQDEYGEYSGKAIETYLDVLSRGGKRIRGALTIMSYEMYGGKNPDIVFAALAIEMMQAYILIIDDINDRSELRRGKQTAHTMLAEYHHTQRFSDGSDHFGESIAMNAALWAQHAAQNLLIGMKFDDAVIRKALQFLNQTYMITVQGQFNDLFNEVIPDVDMNAVDNVLKWKTAYYSFVNPLQLGAIFAGASAPELKKCFNFGLLTGTVYQLQDDIIGIFGEVQKSGKSVMDDLRQGKNTALTVYALKHANKADADYLRMMLGNHHLTDDEFKKCQQIIVDSGALKFTEKRVKEATEKARKIVNNEWSHWPDQGIDFLTGMLDFLEKRES